MQCPHVIKHLQSPCGCCIDCPSKIMMLVSEPTEEHLAQHRELEAGIVHSWDCEPPRGIKKIPVPELVINQELMKKLDTNNNIVTDEKEK